VQRCCSRGYSWPSGAL